MHGVHAGRATLTGRIPVSTDQPVWRIDVEPVAPKLASEGGRMCMVKRTCLAAALAAALCVSLTADGPRRVRAGDWPELRGPNRDGVSIEKGLINTWKLN